MHTLAMAAAAWCCALAIGALPGAAAPGPGVDGAGPAALTVAKAPKKQNPAPKPKPKPMKDQPEEKAKPAAGKAARDGAKTEEKAEAQGGEGGPLLQRSNRLEFDARLIQGQLAKSGAIFLFDRAPRALPPLLKLKRSYLDEIVEAELGADYAKPQR